MIRVWRQDDNQENRARVARVFRSELFQQPTEQDRINAEADRIRAQWSVRKVKQG